MLIVKNIAKKINTVITGDERKEKCILTKDETAILLLFAKNSLYYNLFVLALETGMRIGELMALTWNDVDFENRLIYVKYTLCYFSKDGKYKFELHKPKTKKAKELFH